MADESKKLIDEENEDGEDIQNQTENDETGKSNLEEKNGGDRKSKSGERTFTQTQVTRMMTKEKNQGRNAVYNELGIDPKDAKMMSMLKAFVESQKTDEQMSVEAEANNQAKIVEAENRALVAEAKAEAMMQGVKSQYVEDVVVLVLSKLTDDSDLKTIIGEFKAKYPIWFGMSGTDEDDGLASKGKGKVGQKGTGSSINHADKSKNEEGRKSLGSRLAAQRKSGSKKATYWGGSK